MKKGIILDLDGTLWDTTKQVIPAWNKVLNIFNKKAITYKDMQELMGKTTSEISMILFSELKINEGLKILNKCFEEEQVYLKEHGGLLYPNLEKTLKALKQNYNLYIVSNCQSEYLEAFFTAHNLKHYFSDYETHGNTGLSKGENIQLVINRNNLDKSVYVGDTIGDKESAQHADTPFIYASYGFGNLPKQQHEINEISEIIDCVSKII